MLVEKLERILVDPDLTITNPNFYRTRGRPTGSQNSKKRVNSAFENVEDNERGRRCRVCNGMGHNARTCVHARACD